MSRRNYRKPDTHFLYVMVDLLCTRGHRVGFAAKNIDQHPRAGSYGLSEGIEFEDLPAPTDDSGKIRGTCPDCGDQVQFRWERVRNLLDDNESTGRAHDMMSP